MGVEGVARELRDLKPTQKPPCNISLRKPGFEGTAGFLLCGGEEEERRRGGGEEQRRGGECERVALVSC